MSVFSVSFAKDLLERAVATFAQAYVAAAVVLPGDLFDVQSLKVAAGAAVLAIFKGVAASYKGDPSTASLVN